MLSKSEVDYNQIAILHGQGPEIHHSQINILDSQLQLRSHEIIIESLCLNS